MVKLLRFTFTCFFFFIFLFASPKIVNATVLFEDNFNNGDFSNWHTHIGPGGSWNIINDRLVGSVVKYPDSDEFSYAVAGDINWENYIYEAKIEGVAGVDKKVMFRYQSENTRYDINIINGMAAYLQKWTNGVATGLWGGSFSSYNNQEYSLRIEIRGNHYKLYIDNQPTIDVIDNTNPILTGKIGLQVWPGAYAGTGGRTTTAFDDVLVTTIEETPTPIESPTPTPSPTQIPSPSPTLTPIPTEVPTPTPLLPIIIIPGLGSSWNHEAMTTGRDVNQDLWHAIPGLTLYDNLISTLKEAGYITKGNNKNLFIFYYNWTKPINNIAEDLKNFINEVVNPLNNLNIIGHSMGGMVGRTYLQNNSDHKVNRLITLASPHQGTPKAYYIWEGGQLEKALEPWQRIGAGLILNFRSPLSPTYAEAIRSNIPSIKDLLPSFEYLKKDSGSVPLNTMYYQNNWLVNLNNSLPTYLTSHLNSLIGVIADSTEDWINVRSRDWADKVLNLWPDGKPTGDKINNNGDTYVLSKSANLPGANNVTLTGKDHGTIVTNSESIQKVLETLELVPSSISNIPDFTYNPTLVLYLASPAVVASIQDTNGNPVGFINDRMGVIPNPLPGSYVLTILGTGSGNYNLHLGQILNTGDIWETTSGSIRFGEAKIYHLTFNPNSPQSLITDPSGFILLTSVRNQIGQLKEYLDEDNFDRGIRLLLTAKLNIVERSVREEKYEHAIETLYSLRLIISTQGQTKKLGNDQSIYLKNIIQRIIGDLEKVYLINIAGSKPYREKLLFAETHTCNITFNKAEKELKQLVDKNNSQPFMGTVYLLAKDKLQKGKSTISYESHINLLGARHLSDELLLLTK